MPNNPVDPPDLPAELYNTLAQLPDADPQETLEWLESVDAVIKNHGANRARMLLWTVLRHAQTQGVRLPALTQTDFINTIPAEDEPSFPGDEYIERRIRAYIRWNAAVMVTKGNIELGVGGHISTYASAASLYEVGFNHFFRGGDKDTPADQVFFQGHAAPGIYSRAYLEGYLNEGQLDLFRQETRATSDGQKGLPSYPHPRLMSDFWEFPTVSMGFTGLHSIYQARFNRYMQGRGYLKSDPQVWAFLGDGEMDEPESTAGITLAAREKLDNLCFVINCNLQRLDGPVRGNGKIIQELESLFRGAGWNVIKVIWGRDWDPLLAADTSGELVQRMNTVPDGQFQTYTVETGQYIREHFFESPVLRKLVEHLSDDQIRKLSRGGHDYSKVYAAFKRASEHAGQPTVILAHTIKGWTLGPDFEARNATHQMKKLTTKGLKVFRDRLYLDIPDKEIEDGIPPYAKPEEGSQELEYLHDRRAALGGYIPRRVFPSAAPELPAKKVYAEAKGGAGKMQVATTMAFVRVLRGLLKDPNWGKRIVPIIPDEARTFGMDALFSSLKIYSPHGQLYEPVDRKMALKYLEATDGQILHEGITEAGSVASFHAVGSSYSTLKEPMIPMYIFYSMFGFQRTADSIWSAADQRCRGFLLGATAGGTTLNGEGLQHQDRSSLLMAVMNPACVPYDPSFAFELAVFVEDGLKRMFEDEEDVIYYLTIYNEPWHQPAMPEHVSDDDVTSGLYMFQAGPKGKKKKAQILASGSAMPGAIEAQKILEDEHGVSADLWSAPGWGVLRREALDVERWNRSHPESKPRVPLVTQKLAKAKGPFVAVSDWMVGVSDQIAPWVPGDYQCLGTDGFGRSDTRPQLRRLHQIDAHSVVVCVLHQLAKAGTIKASEVQKAIEAYGIDPELTPELL